MALMHDETTRTRVYRKPSVGITGIHRFCSGALLYGPDGWGQFADYKKPIHRDYSPAVSFVDYIDMWKQHPACQLDRNGVHCYFLEKIWIKAKTGEGGRDMYASQSYPTKTWFMADRRRVGDGLHMMGFMYWLKDLGVGKVGRIHISPYRDGAHGGECKGAVYAPDLTRVRKFLDEELAKWNEHAKEMVKRNFCKAEDVEPKDEIGGLW